MQRLAAYDFVSYDDNESMILPLISYERRNFINILAEPAHICVPLIYTYCVA